MKKAVYVILVFCLILSLPISALADPLPEENIIGKEISLDKDKNIISESINGNNKDKSDDLIFDEKDEPEKIHITFTKVKYFVYIMLPVFVTTTVSICIAVYFDCKNKTRQN